MPFDALLALVPDSRWVTLLALVIIAYLLVERVTNFSTSVVDRRSDKQLLEQADLAATVLEKLPQDHRSRSALLSYIATGPVAELTDRQLNRTARKSDAEGRRLRIFLLIGAMVLVALGYFPQAVEYYKGIAAGLEEPDSSVPGPLMYVFATLMLLLFYLFASALLCAFMLGVYRLAEWAKNGVLKLIFGRKKLRYKRTGNSDGRET